MEAGGGIRMMMGVLAAYVVIVVLRWAWKAMNLVWLKPRKLEKLLRQQGLAGNSYRFLFGDMREISKMRSNERERPILFTNDYFHRINPFQHQLNNKYGKTCFTWRGPVPMINIAEAELIRDVWNRMNEFRKPRLNPLVVLLAPGLVDYEGEKWAKHRKLINPAFHVEKLKLMLPKFHTSIIEMVKQWEKIVSETSEGSSEIDVWPYLVDLAADVISRSAFGSSYEEGRRIFELLTEQKDLVIQLLPTSFIPGWKYVPTKSNRRMKEVNAELQNVLKGIIDKRMKAMEAGEAAKNDLLGILMESNFKEAQVDVNNKQHNGMSFEELIDECKLFYLAGQETTSSLLAWTMILLSKHQDWQIQAREEVLAAFGENQPNFDGLNRLKIVTMILHEALRLYPPIVGTSRRIYGHETKLGDIYVPDHAMVNLSIIEAHHDPKSWGEDAKEFRPDRFSEGIAKATKGHNSFCPFGWGPRICIGQNFALVEAKLALSMILQRFTFELSPSYTHAPTTIIALQPQHGAHIILRRL